MSIPRNFSIFVYCLFACSIYCASSRAQPLDTEILVRAGGGGFASPVRDRVGVDQLIIVEGSNVTRLDVTYDSLLDTDPSVVTFVVATASGIADPRWNPAQTESSPAPLWPNVRYVSYAKPTGNPPLLQYYQRLVDASAAERKISVETDISNRQFPSWNGDGLWLCYEGNGDGFGGFGDQTYRSFFLASPTDDPSEIAVHAQSFRTNEAPVASPATTSSQDSFNFVLTNRQFDPDAGGFPYQVIYQFEATDPPTDPELDELLTIGGRVNWVDATSYACTTSSAGWDQIVKKDFGVPFDSHNLEVLNSDGAGSLDDTNRTTIPVLRTPNTVVVDDINSDGILDTLATMDHDDRVVITIGTGSGQVTRGGCATPENSGPFDLAIHDVTPTDLDPQVVDSALDLVVVERDLDQVRVLWNDGTGAFDLTNSSTFAVEDQPVAVDIGDVNEDSDPNDPRVDLVVANRLSNKVSVLLQDPSFDPNDPNDVLFTSSTFSPGTKPSDLALGDLNKDGHLDIAVSLETDHTIEIWEGDGLGAFSFAYSLEPTDANSISLINPTPSGIVLADFGQDPNDSSDLDGLTDVAAANLVADKVTMWRNYSTPTLWSFSPARFYTVGDGPIGIATADVTGDGITDVVVANKVSNDGTILPGTGNGGFSTGITVPTDTSPWRVACGDYVGHDGKADMAFSCSVSETVSIAAKNPDADPNDPSTHYRLVTSLAVGPAPRAVASGDLNGDEENDLVAASYTGDEVSVLCRSFLASGTILSDPASYVGFFDLRTTIFGLALDTLDFDGDTKRDFVVGGSGASASKNIRAYRGNGDGSFTLLQEITATRVTSIVSSEIANDPNGPAATDDFAALDSRPATSGISMATVKVGLYNNSTDSFDISSFDLHNGTVPWSEDDLRGARQIATTDADGDGDQDLIVVCGAGGIVILCKNDGTGSFSLAQHISPGNEPHQISLEDVNGDGKVDAALTLATSGEVKIYRRPSSGSTFFDATGSNVQTISIPGAYAIASGHFNSDTHIDFAVTSVVASPQDRGVWLLLNDGTGEYQISTGSPFETGPGPIDLAVGEFDSASGGFDDVIVVNALEPGAQYLTARSAGFTKPFASHDGEKIATGLFVDGASDRQILLIEIDGTAPAERIVSDETVAVDRVIDGFGLDPPWSWGPDSRRLYYSRPALPNDPAGVYVVRIE